MLLSYQCPNSISPVSNLKLSHSDHCNHGRIFLLSKRILFSSVSCVFLSSDWIYSYLQFGFISLVALHAVTF